MPAPCSQKSVFGFHIAPRTDHQPKTKTAALLGDGFVYGADNRIRDRPRHFVT